MPASLVSGRLAGEAAQRERKLQLSQRLKRLPLPSTENSAQRTASRGGTRVIYSAPSMIAEPLAITHRARAKTRPTKRQGQEERGAT